MLKLVMRVGLATFAGLGCCCVVEPEAPLSLLKSYLGTQESTDAPDQTSSVPKIDLAVMKATLAMLNRQSLESPAGMPPSVQLDPAKQFDHAKQQLDDMFFSDAESKTKESLFSKGKIPKVKIPKVKIPFLSNNSDQKFEPIDVGATIQSNPFSSK